ncbi:heavy-metal-associated domain-containing protein [Sulfurimonas marina]|uniref:Heavy-metal-associated domain-containing protein n=1 Tax=Sulfurimonas marina TaxID=2590551 RepID=A0A7M1AXP9_9BACT|nr:heavy-metal-associated domain-containing protein [Sulfurimonas marina]QOP42214.1 heavy-metal-associated domain-containing protein [Sulfurimonas marina]
MKQTFQVENVKCGGCANTLITKLKEDFGEVEVNLDVLPREISLDIKDENIETLRTALKKLGYPMSDEKLSFIDSNATKAKSFVSCAVGKFELKNK